ncbi:hypothetical protein [Pantoea dispersa]|jgi:hypothetical protein|uniref:hypothetical protein n=1 Tax=Pantoea dispersa TaxID=59814 RepID=UPI002865FDD8|nr:hypothetical protein [Pantoea dispersa]MDR6298966.1 hypothetical protein [Pantoea dispersa]
MNSGISEVMVNELDRLVSDAKALNFPSNLAANRHFPIAIARFKRWRINQDFIPAS